MKNSVLKVFLVLTLIFAVNVIALNDLGKSNLYLAGDDLPHYTGTSIPRG